MDIKTFVLELEKDIRKAYEESPTMEEAEKLAAKFLSAQIILAGELAACDLDARMRKAGLKRVKAAVYSDAVGRSDKKPTEATLASIVDMNELVEGEQAAFDAAEVHTEQLKNYLNIMREAHVYFRQVSKGSFNG